MKNQETHLRQRNLPLLMLQAREAVFERFRPILAEAGLTEQHWRIIRALLENGPLEPRQIGSICCLSSPSLAGILARMEALELVHRERLEHDQRRVLVSVSDKGREIARRLAPAIQGAYAELEKQLGKQVTQDLHTLLDLVISRLKSD